MNRFAALLLLTCLAGCGFHPLYKQTNNVATVQEMASIQIDPPTSRVQQELRNELLDRLSPRGKAAQTKYRLQLTINESQGGVLVNRADTTTRTNLNMQTAYALFRIGEDHPVVSGLVTALASYNVLLADYATLVAERDARARAVRETSDEIRIRLAIFFERGGPSAVPPPVQNATDLAPVNPVGVVPDTRNQAE